MGWGNGLQEVKHSWVRSCFWHCIEHELHGRVLLAVQCTWHIMHSHISYCSFPCRWITGGWGCCVTSFLLDNHRLRPRVHTKHTIEYPRSATTLWCVHGSPNPAFSFWVWNRKPAMYIALYSPLMFWPNQGTILHTCRLLVLCTTRGDLSLIPRFLSSFLLLAVRLSIHVLQAMRSWVRPWKQG